VTNPLNNNDTKDRSTLKERINNRKKSQSNGVEEETPLSQLRQKLAERKKSIDKKTREIRDIITEPDTDELDQKEDGDHSEEIIAEQINADFLTEGPIQDNITSIRKSGERVPLKERISQRRTEIKEKFPNGAPKKKYEHSEKIPTIREYLLEQGVSVDDYRDQYFRRTLKKRLIRLRMSSYAEYMHFLKNNHEEIDIFRDSLSINVTRFYRNRDSWEFIETQVFNQLFNKTKLDPPEQKIRIWSAGCAVGAEPYSISIAYARRKFELPSNPVEIIATDIKEELLEMARTGSYTDEHLSELTNAEISKYFDKEEHNFHLQNTIKSRVKFQRLDLVNDSYPGMFDLIICRNVLIYIDKEAKKRVFKKFFRSLKPGGFLVIGRSESIVGKWQDQVKTYSLKHRVYQKL
jgi:chemotaxis protein methyltransferase CheR